MTSPIDFFKINTLYAKKEKAQNRYDICKPCDNFLPTTQCKKCGCFMKFKVKLEDSSCPINKW